MPGSAEKGPRDLQKEVLSAGQCSACGACVNLCPYIEMVEGRAVIVDDCNLRSGRCYDFCPKTCLDVFALDRWLFGAHKRSLSIGSNIAVVKARATDHETRSTAQYGGVVSSLVAFALENGRIDSAVLAGLSSDKITPEPVIVKRKSEVLRCAGSKYIVCPTISRVPEAVEDTKGKTGLVGTPCQVAAIRKIQEASQDEGNRFGLVLGLFCTWALSPRAYDYLRRMARSKGIVRLDIPPPPANVLVVETEEERLTAPLEDVKRFIMPACNTCFDMTSEFSDISAGAVEGEEGWDTVIIRTRLGEEVFKQAAEAGVIETAVLEKEKLRHLCEASLSRKKRALLEMESKNISNVVLPTEDREKIISDVEA